MAGSEKSRISIQVSLGGYSFTVEDGSRNYSSGWLGAERIFTTPEFQRRYDSVEIALLTPKCALVPEGFYSEEGARGALSDVVRLRESDPVHSIRIPSLAAVLLYSNAIDESLSRVIAQSVLTTGGEQAPVLPEMYYLLTDLPKCREYNKILASWRDGYLYLVVGQGKSLLLSNVFPAVDFTTAEYFIFLSLKRLQLNPEVSVISWRTPITAEEEMSLYRYFKAVEQL
jgi:hypothetical protein